MIRRAFANGTAARQKAPLLAASPVQMLAATSGRTYRMVSYSSKPAYTASGPAS